MSSSQTEKMAAGSLEKSSAQSPIQETDVATGISQIELKIKQAELSLKEQEARKPLWASPLVVAIFAAALAGFGNAVVATINGRQ